MATVATTAQGVERMTNIERQRAEYGLRTLRRLKYELENSADGNQFKKYPFDIGGPGWIIKEIERQEAELNK